MAEAVTAPKPKGQEDYEYVTVPERDDIREWPHPKVIISYKEYGPGTHLVDASSAQTIRERMKLYRSMLLASIHTKATSMAKSMDRQ